MPLIKSFRLKLSHTLEAAKQDVEKNTEDVVTRGYQITTDTYYKHAQNILSAPLAVSIYSLVP